MLNSAAVLCPKTNDNWSGLQPNLAISIYPLSISSIVFFHTIYSSEFSSNSIGFKTLISLPNLSLEKFTYLVLSTLKLHNLILVKSL